MHSDDPEINEAVAGWDTYNSTPYAPYMSLPDFMGWTLEEYDHWRVTGEKPLGWKFNAE